MSYAFARAFVSVPVEAGDVSEAAMIGLVRRARTETIGRCPCGASWCRGIVVHEDDCPATSPAVDAALDAGCIALVVLSPSSPALL